MYTEYESNSPNLSVRIAVLLSLLMVAVSFVMVAPMQASAAPGDLAQELKEVAEDERSKWRNGSLSECSTNGKKYIKTYWESFGQRTKSCSDVAWSGAFISAVQKWAGSGSEFTYSGLHAHYIGDALKDRADGRNALYVAYRPDEVKVEVGDLVCAGRRAKSNGKWYDHRSFDFDRMNTEAQRSARGKTWFFSHCDLVTSVARSSVTLVGGNVSNSVKNTNLTTRNGKVKGPNGLSGDAAVVLKLRGGSASNPAPGDNGGNQGSGTGSLVGKADLCLDVPYANNANGKDLWMWTCNDTAAQEFTYDAAKKELRVLGKCLDIEGRERSGSDVQITLCGYTGDLNWYFTSAGEIRTERFPGLCLDVRHGGTTPRSRVQVWDCNGTAAQRWELR